MGCRFNPRCQLLNRTDQSLTEFTQSSPVQTSVEGFTHVRAREPKVDVILIIGHGVLDEHESAGVYHIVGVNVPLS
jgi:hypothetical protein